jgi:capsular exopolysaccharide synthesis family protein
MTNTIATPEVIQLPVQESGLSLSELRQSLICKWKPALAIGIIAFGGIFIPTILQTPKYQSESLILLDNPKNQQSASVAPSQQPSIASSFYSLKDLSTEIIILRSYALVSKAIKQLKQEYPDLSTTEVLENLLIRQATVEDVPTDVLIVAYTDLSPEKAKTVLEALGSVYVDYSLERQRRQASNAIIFINEQLPKAQEEVDRAGIAIRHFRQRHNVVEPNEYALQVAEFRQYLEQQIKETEIALSRTQRQYQELSRQLTDLGQNPETIVAYNVLGQDQVYQNLATQLKDLETQYALGGVNFHDGYYVMEDLKLQRQELQRLLRERAKQILGNAVSQVAIEEVSVTPASGATIAQTSSSTTSGSTEAATNTSDSQVSAAGSTLQNLANELLVVQNEYASLYSQLEGIRQAKSKVEADFQRIPQLQQVFEELQRKFEVKSNAVNYLLERKQELEIAAAEEIAPWQVLDDPYLPTTPISPNIQRGLALAFVASGFLGVCTAWLLQKLDQRVKLIEEAKHLTQLPLLGAIPKVQKPLVEINSNQDEQSSYSYKYSYSSFTEGLRAVAMNLSYFMVETGRVKSLGFTSATSGEGKTTITYNLALILAELNWRVLIVDADLRKPRLHKVAKLTNEQGLTTAIASEQPWSDFVQTGVVENLHLMTSGPTSVNPVAMLSSQKMRQMIQEWREAYDYVLIDTPPIGVMTDAKILANQVDSMIFVTGIGRANRKAIEHSLDILRGSRCNIAGFLANLVDRNIDYYAYSYYDYYYSRPDNNSNSNGNGHDGGILQQFHRH